jgi:exodeoxyribonuclease VII small subunit
MCWTFSVRATGWKKKKEPHLASFEEQMKRLEEIVSALEDGNTPLEKSIELFEEGTRLAEECRTHLEKAEGKIEILMRQRNGKMKAEPFEANQEG